MKTTKCTNYNRCNGGFLLLNSFKFNSQILIFFYLLILFGYNVAVCWDRNINELHCIVQFVNHYNIRTTGRNYLISPNIKIPQKFYFIIFYNRWWTVIPTGFTIIYTKFCTQQPVNVTCNIEKLPRSYNY